MTGHPSKTSLASVPEDANSGNSGLSCDHSTIDAKLDTASDEDDVAVQKPEFVIGLEKVGKTC